MTIMTITPVEIGGFLIGLCSGRLFQLIVASVSRLRSAKRDNEAFRRLMRSIHGQEQA